MPAKKYRERVTFQERTQTATEGGERTFVWVDLMTVWAEVLPSGAVTVNEHGQQVGDQSYRVTVRRSPDTCAITSLNRIVWRGTNLNVSGINFDPSLVEIEYLAVQQKGAT